MSWQMPGPRDRIKTNKYSNTKIALANFSLENNDILKEIHYFLC